jgi:hypothetical protein
MEESKHSMEDRLWEYIDGAVRPAESSAVTGLIETNQLWRDKYLELLEIHRLAQASALDEPSLRFTKNIMEEIARLQIAPASKNYINNKIIWGIGLFFITMILGFLVYGIGQVDWSAGNSGSMPIDLGKVNFGRFFNNTYMNVFLMVNVILGLMLLDRYLETKRKKFQKEA